jgi:hypothetical protein
MNTSVSLHEIDDVVKDLKALKKQTGLPKEAQHLITRIANTVSRWQSAGQGQDTGSDFST